MTYDKKKAVLKKIQKTGFPSELEISDVFRKSGWRVRYNNYYIDHDDKKGREIDLICEYLRLSEITTAEEHLELVLNLSVEIKKSKKPWIFFSTPATELEKITQPPFIANWINFNNSDENYFNLPHKYFNNKFQELENRFARSFYDKDDEQIYKALCSVVKATEHAYESNFINQEKNHKLPKGYKLLYYYEPVIIFDGEIFEAFLNEESEIEVVEAKYIQVSFNYLSPNYKNRKTGYLVHVVQSENLPHFLQKKKEKFLEVTNEILKSEMPHMNF